MQFVVHFISVRVCDLVMQTLQAKSKLSRAHTASVCRDTEHFRHGPPGNWGLQCTLLHCQWHLHKNMVNILFLKLWCFSIVSDTLKTKYCFIVKMWYCYIEKLTTLTR